MSQVQGYLRFAKFKRDQHLREVKGVLSDFSDYRIKDNEVYTTKEVKSLIDDLSSEVLLRVDLELENASYASGLLLRLLFQQAEMADLLLEADTNELENEFLLKQVHRNFNRCNEMPCQGQEYRKAWDSAMLLQAVEQDDAMFTDFDRAYYVADCSVCRGGPQEASLGVCSEAAALDQTGYRIRHPVSPWVMLAIEHWLCCVGRQRGGL